MRSLPAAALLLLPAVLAADPGTADRARAREIYEQLVEIDTSGEKGTTVAAEAVAARLRAAGLPREQVQLLGPSPNKQNLVAHIRGRSRAKPPLFLLAHLDVVTALRSDWTVEPFELLERDGYFYGRGTFDDKAMASIWTELFVRFVETRARPERDLILMLTADEEGGAENGASWLLEQHPDLIARGGLVLNEGGLTMTRDGKRLLVSVQVSEKLYSNFWLTVTDPGGHSSVPRKDNAIYRLAAALSRIEAKPFPIELSPATQRYLAAAAALEGGETGAALAAILRNPNDGAAADFLAEHPRYDAMLRTTCTPTRLDAGHADNALPQTARAHLNCRILPWRTLAETQRHLAAAIADERVTISAGVYDHAAPASALDTTVMDAFESIARALWPGVQVVPVMSLGASDSHYFRMRGIPAFGVASVFSDLDSARAHGRDERLAVKWFEEGHVFLERLLRKLAGM